MIYDSIFRCFPNRIKEQLERIILEKQETKYSLEEIRIRIGLPIILKILNEEKVLDYLVTREELNEIIQRICENSLYSYQNQIINGFVTINGGHRVGIVGSAVLKDEKVINLNYMSSLNFRVNKQILNCSDCIIKDILDIEHNNVYNTLIVSPPGFGKTTLLRDIVRRISQGIDIAEGRKFKGINVTVVDERGEIGACYKGKSQMDLGIRTDIFDNMPKAIGMKMAIRSMAPKVIVADEIGSLDDSEAIQYAVCCGIKGIFTAHGKNIMDLKKNPNLSDLIESKLFERIIIIKGRRGNVIDKEIFSN